MAFSPRPEYICESPTPSVSSHSRCSSPGPDADFYPCISKREYLLAQIRQKDAIIESLLKQLHNPYLATPLSIESYRMATSPSDSNKTNILAWLDRLTASVREPKKPDMSLFDGLTRISPEVDSDEESDAANTSKIPGLKQDDDDEADLSPTLETPPNALPELHVPFKLMEAMSLDRQRGERKKKSKDDGEFKDDENVGIANDSYFKPGDLGRRSRLIEQHNLPEIIVHGLVKPDDVERLFGIFYERVNPFISLLDPVLHTSHTTFARCPFLFTVICAISSRYYSEKSEIYPIAMHFAKHSAANALIDGWKSVELCQAYILMSIYAVPARRWEEDRSWLYTGLAIRIATDLNLHQVSTVKPQSERQEREILNKRRVWMICFNLDRSTATQFGKPSTIKEDYIVRSAKDWYKHSQYNHKYDIHLCAHSALLQIVAKFHDEIFSDSSSPSGLNKKVNFRSVTLAHDEHLRRYHEEWAKRFEEESDPNDPACVFRCSLLPFLVAYSRLVMFSFGFQQAYHRGLERGDEIFYTTCLQAAKTVIQTMLDQLAPSGYMKYAPDGHFVFASFASAFLLKLLRPEFSSFSGAQEQETEIFELIGRLIETLSSTKIAIDDRHTPKLYARFLLNLLSRHRRDGTFVGQLRTNPPPRLDSSMSDSTQQSQTGVSRYPVNMGLQDMSQTMHYGGAMGGGQQDFSQALMAAAGELKFVTEFDAASGLGIGAEEDMHLHTLEAITNPGWWANMMMPGFSWPEPTPSPPANVPQQHANMNMHSLQPTYGIFHTSPQVLI